MRKESEIREHLSKQIKKKQKLEVDSKEHDRMSNSPSGSSENPYKKEIIITNHVIQTLKFVLGE